MVEKVVIRKDYNHSNFTTNYIVSCLSCNIHKGILISDRLLFAVDRPEHFILSKVSYLWQSFLEECEHARRINNNDALENIERISLDGYRFRPTQMSDNSARRIIEALGQQLDSVMALRPEDIGAIADATRTTNHSSCRQCDAVDLPNWFTSKRDGTVLCQACFEGREESKFAKEVLK